MNKAFREKLVVSDYDEEKIRKAAIQVLTGNKTIKQVCEEHKDDVNFPKAEKTLRAKIEQLAGKDRDINALYLSYVNSKSDRARGYSYIPEIIDMLENDLSQRQIAEKYNISRNTLKTVIEKAKDNPEIGSIIQEHTARHSQGRNCSPLIWTPKYKKTIEEFKEKHGLEKVVSDNKSVDVATKEQLETIITKIKKLEEQGCTTKQIAYELGIGESTIRAYKARMERLIAIEERKNMEK